MSITMLLHLLQCLFLHGLLYFVAAVFANEVIISIIGLFMVIRQKRERTHIMYSH